MLALFALSLLIFTQTTLASGSDDDWLDLRDPSRLLEAEKRYADKYAASMRAKKTPDDIQCSPADVGLIIDASRSIHPTHFKKGLEFLAKLVDKYNIGPTRNQDRVAAVTFGNGVYGMDGFNFTTYNNGQEVKAHLLNMYFRAGDTTSTAMALEYMRNIQVATRRSGVRQIQVVLTDGKSDRPLDTKEQARMTKEANIMVLAVGVGDGVDGEELVNITGGVVDHVLQARTYDDLDTELLDRMIMKICKPCGEKFPADINFVFSAATMGLGQTSTVTSFINNVIDHKKLKVGFQFGVVSGDCPDDEGFRLNQYSSSEAIRTHLERYDRNNLPNIVQQAEKRFTPQSGARHNANKVVVIFLDKNKVNKKELRTAIKTMLASDVRVFVSYKKIPEALARYLPKKVTLLQGSMVSQVNKLVNQLCPNMK